ncbi:MAG: GTPase ObgE [Clostridiales bacterium]|nr:GTPase ObgE [Candidatus Equinaster intestinalis]
MFVDVAKIHLKAGNGGNGAATFHREKYVAAGGPDGGDGGRGGNIVFKVDDNLSTLADFRYKRKYIADDGEKGSGNRCTGKSAKDLIVFVPRGTLVKELESGRIIADISDDEPVIIAKGGNGGWGNCHFATATRQVPRFANDGQKGEELDILLELKLLADVGLIGFPNVGKSTLVSVVSEAKPKIANYHFTTLTPVLGVVRIDEGASFVMADIPGLIEGAGEGVGLGHEFLRHVERCRLLLHVIDVSGSEGRDPIEDFEKINHELGVFSEELAERPQIVVANKCDLTDEEEINRIKKYFTDKGYAFFPIMAAIAEGTRELIDYTAGVLATLPPILKYESETVKEIVVEKEDKQTFRIEVRNGVFYIEDADWIDDIMNKVDPDDYESLQYFERALRSSGIIKALEQAGVRQGDTVSVCGVEFDYVP